jgi:small subunit ribosomal protein S4
MSRYTGPKARINRRLGAMIYESNGASKGLERRPNPPGMHTRGKRPTNYGLALYEKKKIKHYYGLGEKQLRRYYDKASSLKGNTGEQLLLMCESRLDNIVRRVGLSKTRCQARQGVAHGHFFVNGSKVDRPSFQVRPGDVITIRNKPGLRNLYQSIMAQGVDGTGIDWVSFDNESMTATVQGVPGPTDISLPVDANMVIEFMSR